MAVIELTRRANGRQGSKTKSDLRVYGVSEKKGRMSVGLRVSDSCMKRIGWSVGDRVTASFDDETHTWTIQKATDRKKGNALSGHSKGGGSGTVRFVIERMQFAPLRLNGTEGYDAYLVSFDADRATFKVLL